MDLSKQTLFKMIAQRMAYIGQRQKVLAQNVANANTPSYQARDLKPLNFKDQISRELHRVTPAMTQPNHLPPVTAPEPFEAQKQKRPYETSLDKNGVVLEEQAVKISNNAGDFQTTTAIYRKYLSMFKMAAK
jgi:flagellar basal-body rod protein FlgB